MSTSATSIDELEVALSELRSVKSGRAVRERARRDRAREGGESDDDRRERANRLTARTFDRRQVYEKRGDLYFLSDKKQATANVKAAVASAKEKR